MQYKYIIFDLDGTLTDPYEGITNSIKYAMKVMDKPIPADCDLALFIGPPLYYSFEHYTKLTAEESVRAVDEYRVYYKDRGLYENKIYDGIADLLRDIRGGSGMALVGTSKPQVFAEEVLRDVKIHQYFNAISGADMKEAHSSKEEIIRRSLMLAGISEDEYKYCLMVGDRKFDVEGAKLCGIHSVGVTWGYGDRAELEAEGATYVVDAVEELKNIIFG
ncbi:MAG: HAD family hydrolase [Ruminococcaceae bacterium]|nr:HAD family hydrolase [Oscillospiraceae bacterium]